MKCPECGGLMLKEGYVAYAYVDSDTHLKKMQWKCVRCNNRIQNDKE